MPRPVEIEAPPPPGAGQRILLVEDNDINRMVARAVLARGGYEVDDAADGVQAVAAATTRPYALILMDIQMPGIDGFEATRRIRQAGGPAATTPIVAMTANAMSGDRERCLAAGMDDYLAKPIVAERLLATAARWVAPSRAAGPAAAPAPLLESAPPVLALPVLNELRTLLDPASLNAAVARYLEVANTTLSRLAEAAEAGDLDRLGAEAHDFKANAASFGLARLRVAAERLEDACRRRDGDAARTLAAEIAVIGPAAWVQLCAAMAEPVSARR